MDPEDSRRTQRGVLRADRVFGRSNTPQDEWTDQQDQDPNQWSSFDFLERVQEICGGRAYRQIARDTGNHPETVRRYINGKSTPSVEFIGGICRAYGYSVDWLVCSRGKKRYPTRRVTSLAAASVEQLCEMLEKRVEMREKGAAKAFSELQAKMGDGSKPSELD